MTVPVTRPAGGPVAPDRGERGERGHRGQRGAATVLGVALLGVLLLVAAALGTVGAVFAAHRSAQAAADLAALAGAGALQQGADACFAAARVAGDNGAQAVRCTVTGAEVEVEALVRGPRWLGRSADPVGVARAGPA